MTDKDFSPLTPSTVRALNDKLYEKRKVAALEIERMVKEYVVVNNTAQILRLLRVLGQDFALSHNANSRKGGLIGLAACAIALSKDSCNYTEELVKPVINCFFDSDARVRYYGCESLYNIVKVARGSVLPFFNQIFDGLSKLCADPDTNVRSGAELLDRLMKDIVTESCQFDLVAFMPLLRERIYTKNPFARQFIVSWIVTLDAVPDVEVVIFLPEILDGLFEILSDNTPEIRKMCEAALGEFLNSIESKSSLVDYPGMANILVKHAASEDYVIKYMAIMWLKQFVAQSGRVMLPFTSSILMAVLPCLSYEDMVLKKTQDAAKSVNTNLLRLVGPEDDKALEKSEKENVIQLDLPSVVGVLTCQLVHDAMQTRIAALRWIYHLLTNTPNRMFCHVDEVFPLLLKALSDPADEVALLDLEVLAEISSSPAGKKFPVQSMDKVEASLIKAVEESHHMTGHFTQFLLSLMQLFSTDKILLEDRGSFIIRQLCLLLNAEDIYRCCSEILLLEKDLKFAALMIETLSTILLTSTELFELRSQLKDLKTKESCSLFCCLYRSWCHNPVSTVALCLLTQNYKHASQLLTLFGDLEVTVSFLTEIDKLVQLIESPIFTYMRLQLLDAQCHQHLLRALYGLLMLLPQSDAFRTLQHRLQCVPSIQFLPPDVKVESSVDNREVVKKHVNFPELLSHFESVQQKHRSSRHKPKTLENIDRKYLE